MRLLLCACLVLAGCPQGPGPQPEGEERRAAEPAGPEIKPVEPRPDETRLTLASPLPSGVRRSRYSRITMKYRILRSGLPGFAGQSAERTKEEQFSAALLRPGTIRRDYQLSSNKVVSTRDGKQLGRQVQQTPLHGRQVNLQEKGERGVEVWDAGGPLAAETAGQMVYDLISLQELLPPRPVQIGERWDAPAAAITRILGATEPGRKIEGRITCTLQRIVELDGARAAELRLAVEVTLVDRKVVQEKIEYRMTTRLSLSGSYYHAIAGRRPLRLDLEGRATLDHEPLRVDFIPPGTEPLSKPFHAEGTMSVMLRFPGE